MKKIAFIFALCLFSYPSLAQDTPCAKERANRLGVPIVCDSSGKPYDNRINYEDVWDEIVFNGSAILDLFIDKDSIHIDSISVNHLRREDGYKIELDSNEYIRISTIILREVQDGLDKGFIVYPDNGEWLEYSSRYQMRVRVQIKNSLETN